MNDYEEEYRSQVNLPKGEQKIPWKSSKEQQWAILEEKLTPGETKVLFFHRPVVRFAVAAAVLVIIAFSAFLRFYTVEYSTTNGQQQIVTLPDGSTSKLNAGSELSFNPYWWGVTRNVYMDGEGYFEVQKGKDFTVFSKTASTKVLGTKFNIYSRKADYRVTCFEGSVQVENETGNKVIITPNQVAISLASDFEIEEIKPNEINKTWKDNYFKFTSTSLVEVIEEIERQYDINIEYSGEEFLYTGNFTRDQTVESTLSIVSLSLNLQVEKKNSNTYILK